MNASMDIPRSDAPPSVTAPAGSDTTQGWATAWWSALVDAAAPLWPQALALFGYGVSSTPASPPAAVGETMSKSTPAFELPLTAPGTDVRPPPSLSTTTGLAPSSLRVLDLGVLAKDSTVRTRNVDDHLLLEVVSADNKVQDEHVVKLADLAAVKVQFGDDEGPTQFSRDKFADNYQTYLVNSCIFPKYMRCGAMLDGFEISPDTPLLPAIPTSQAVL